MDTSDSRHKLIYEKKCVLSHEGLCRQSRIIDIAFNGDGGKLATSSVDGMVCIWNVEREILLYAFSCDGKSLSIIWQQVDGKEKLLCGMSTGELLLVSVLDSSNDVGVSV